MKSLKLAMLTVTVLCLCACEKEATDWEKEGLDLETPLAYKTEIVTNTSNPYASFAAVNEITQSNRVQSTYTLFLPALAGAERSTILTKPASEALKIKSTIGTKAELEPKIKNLVYERSQMAFLTIQQDDCSDLLTGKSIRRGARYDFTGSNSLTRNSSKLTVILKNGATQEPIVGTNIKVEIIHPLVANRLTEQSQTNDAFDYIYYLCLDNDPQQIVLFPSADDYKRISDIYVAAVTIRDSNPLTNLPIELLQSNTPEAPSNLYTSVIAPQTLWGQNAKYTKWVAETKMVETKTVDAVNSSVRVTLPAKTAINSGDSSKSYTINCSDISISAATSERATLTEIKSGENVVITLLLDATQQISATAEIYKW